METLPREGRILKKKMKSTVPEETHQIAKIKAFVANQSAKV
jgi:hypothetical protein